MRKQIKQIVLEAGEILKTNFYKTKEISTKSSYRDLVTKIDSKIEIFLKEKFKEILPESEFLSEETASEIKKAEALWVIDPIDGTVNFVHKFPFVAVSTALMINNELEYAFVYNPILNEFFEAEKGKGSFLNGEKLSVSKNTNLSNALCATGFPYVTSGVKNEIFDFLKIIKSECRGIRRAGSAALDLCYIAKGVFDGFWEYKLQPWDVAAAILIIQEAGGKVTNQNGEQYKFGDPVIFAGNLTIQCKILERFYEFKKN